MSNKINVKHLGFIFLGSKRQEKEYKEQLDKQAHMAKTISDYKRGRKW